MSEYFLADIRARERELQRKRELELRTNEPKQAQDIKITLLGDFLFPTQEPQGCDPYNSTNGRPPRDAWKTRRDRR